MCFWLTYQMRYCIAVDTDSLFKFYSLYWNDTFPRKSISFSADLVPESLRTAHFAVSFVYKTTIFTQSIMKLYFKIGRLKFPIQGLLEGYDNLVGGFNIFNVQYFCSLMGFYKNYDQIHWEKLFFIFKKEIKNDNHLLIRLSRTKRQGSY